MEGEEAGPKEYGPHLDRYISRPSMDQTLRIEVDVE
jgi:hypothetical protein